MTLDGTLSQQAANQIYRNAQAIYGRDDLGLSVGRQLHLSTHGPLGAAISSGPDLRTGMYLLEKYSQTRVDFFDISLAEHEKGLKLTYTETFDLADLRAFLTESVLSSLFSAITFFVDTARFNGQVNFAYAKPSYWEKYHHYYGAHLNFDHKKTEVIIPDAVLSLPSPTADRLMHQEAIALCERQLREIKPGQTAAQALPTQDRVIKLMTENPGKIWGLNELAEKMHMSGRTLIRRLADEGTTFKNLRDDLAKQQAANYFHDGGLSVESVGYLMGFSDVSSFRRSFKRWFGETPSQYMARIRNS